MNPVHRLLNALARLLGRRHEVRVTFKITETMTPVSRRVTIR